MKTYSTRPADVQDHWHVIDAQGARLGHVATVAAQLLRGKHKPIYSTSVDAGDHVIIINAAKVEVSGRKADQNKVRHHTGYPGGLKEITLGKLLASHPDRVIMGAVKGMLPKNKLGAQQLKKLRVYVGAEHPHVSQQPQDYKLESQKG